MRRSEDIFFVTICFNQLPGDKTLLGFTMLQQKPAPLGTLPRLGSNLVADLSSFKELSPGKCYCTHPLGNNSSQERGEPRLGSAPSSSKVLQQNYHTPKQRLHFFCLPRTDYLSVKLPHRRHIIGTYVKRAVIFFTVVGRCCCGLRASHPYMASDRFELWI